MRRPASKRGTLRSSSTTSSIGSAGASRGPAAANATATATSVVSEIATHQRPHHGLGNCVLTASAAEERGDVVVADERLGGLLRSYRRTA